MIVLAPFPLFSICFSPFLKYRTCQYFIFKLNTILFLNYFMCTIFLQTSLTTALRIRIWLSLLFLYHICLYNAHKIKCAGQGHLSSATSPCTTFSVLPDTAKLSNASLILWLQIICPLHYVLLWKVFHPSRPTSVCMHSVKLFDLSIQLCRFGAGREVYMCIIILYHFTYHTLLFYVRNFVFIWSLFGMNLYKVRLYNLYKILVRIYTKQIKFYTF